MIGNISAASSNAGCGKLLGEKNPTNQLAAAQDRDPRPRHCVEALVFLRCEVHTVTSTSKNATLSLIIRLRQRSSGLDVLHTETTSTRIPAFHSPPLPPQTPPASFKSSYRILGNIEPAFTQHHSPRISMNATDYPTTEVLAVTTKMKVIQRVSVFVQPVKSSADKRFF